MSYFSCLSPYPLAIPLFNSLFIPISPFPPPFSIFSLSPLSPQYYLFSQLINFLPPIYSLPIKSISPFSPLYPLFPYSFFSLLFSQFLFLPPLLPFFFSITPFPRPSFSLFPPYISSPPPSPSLLQLFFTKQTTLSSSILMFTLTLLQQQTCLFT